jgi:hypothetical protein
MRSGKEGEREKSRSSFRHEDVLLPQEMYVYCYCIFGESTFTLDQTTAYTAVKIGKIRIFLQIVLKIIESQLMAQQAT